MGGVGVSGGCEFAGGWGRRRRVWTGRRSAGGRGGGRVWGVEGESGWRRWGGRLGVE